MVGPTYREARRLYGSSGCNAYVRAGEEETSAGVLLEPSEASGRARSVQNPNRHLPHRSCAVGGSGNWCLPVENVRVVRTKKIDHEIGDGDGCVIDTTIFWFAGPSAEEEAPAPKIKWESLSVRSTRG